MARCTAKSKTTGKRCRQHPKPGFTVCHYHGGGTPVGIATPQFKNGAQSRHHPLPARMRETYEAGLKDQNLVELRADLALLDARMADVLKRVDTGESGAIWQALKEAQAEADEANRAEDHIALGAALRSIRELIVRGHGDWAAWGEVRSILEQRRKLSESERKREVEAKQVISSERAMALITAVIDSVERNVTDRKVLTRISHDVSAILNAPEP